jgi:hypothetical protein
VELVFVVDGHRMPHHDFPDQQPYLLTVEPSPPATAAAPMPGTLLAAGAAIGGLVIAYRQVRRRARSVPAA